MNAALLGLSAASLRRGVGLSDDKQLRAFEEMAQVSTSRCFFHSCPHDRIRPSCFTDTLLVSLLPSLQISLLPRIERKLRMKCTELCDIMLPGLAQSHNHTIDASRGASSSISRIAELPALLLEAQARKAQLEQETEQLKDHLHAQLLQDIERCRAMTSLVAQLLIDHKRDDQTRVLHAKIQWLAAFSEAMRLKAQVLTSQLVVETYTPEKIDALRAAQCVLCVCVCVFLSGAVG